MRVATRIALACVLLAGTGLLVPRGMAQPAPPKRVLVLMPFQISRPASVVVLRGIEDGLKANYPGQVDVVADSVSGVPPEPEDFQRRMSEWLAYKYAGQHFDAIVSVISPPVPYAISLRDRFWPSAPILFVIQEEDRERFPPSVPQSSRVIVALSNTETVRSALQMLPSTRHLVILEGSSEQDLRSNAEIVRNLRRAQPDLDIIEIAGQTWEATEERVRSVPAHSIILIGSYFFDRNHRELTVPQQVNDLAPIVNAPIFADSDVGLGKGAVGGSVLSVGAAGMAAGGQLAKLLKGADPATMAESKTENSYIVDWRQLQRWGIPESRLPANATILYRPPSAWEQYRRSLIAFAVVLAVLLALVIFLLVERQRRRKEEELNSAMLESLPGQALLVNGQGEILRTNQLHRDAEGAGTNGVHPGFKYREYLHQLIGPENGFAGAVAIEQVIAGTRPSATTELPLAVGERWIEVRAIQLPQQQSGSLVVHLDITQRKRAELERTRSRTEIYHLNRVAAMGQLAASLAHELSQPLAAIMSNAEAAQRFAGRPNPEMVEIREALDDITRDDKRARGVIQGMRAMLKNENVTVEPVDLNQIATSVVQMIRNEATLRGMRIELALCPSAVMVKGDQIGLQQVVLNLASNGLDAMTDATNERYLTIRTEVEANSGMIWVIDNGPGVSAAVRDKLFQPFFTTKHTGLGMGLSICQSILESLGGRIDLENHEDKGAAFFVTLPLA